MGHSESSSSIALQLICSQHADEYLITNIQYFAEIRAEITLKFRVRSVRTFFVTNEIIFKRETTKFSVFKKVIQRFNITTMGEEDIRIKAIDALMASAVEYLDAYQT